MQVGCPAGTTFWPIKVHILCDVEVLLSKSPFQHILIHVNFWLKG